MMRETQCLKLAGVGSWMTTESATGGGILDSCEQQAVQKQRNHQGMKLHGRETVKYNFKQLKYNFGTSKISY